MISVAISVQNSLHNTVTRNFQVFHFCCKYSQTWSTFVEISKKTHPKNSEISKNWFRKIPKFQESPSVNFQNENFQTLLRSQDSQFGSNNELQIHNLKSKFQTLEISGLAGSQLGWASRQQFQIYLNLAPKKLKFR